MTVRTNTLKSIVVGPGRSTGSAIATLDSTNASATDESAVTSRVYHRGTLQDGEAARFRSAFTNVIQYDNAASPDIAAAFSASLTTQPKFVFTGSGLSETFFSGTSYQSTADETAASWAKFVEDWSETYPNIAEEPDITVIQRLVMKPRTFGIGMDPSTWTKTELEESASKNLSVTRLVGDVYQYLDGPETVYLLPSGSTTTPYFYGELGVGAYDEGTFSKIEDYEKKNAMPTANHIGSQWPKVEFKTLKLAETDVTDGFLTVKFDGSKLETLLTKVQCDTTDRLAPYEAFRTRQFGDSFSMHIGDEYNFTEFNPIFNLGVQTAVAIGKKSGWMIKESDINEDDQKNHVWSNSAGDASKSYGSSYSYSLGFSRNYSESENGGISSREGIGKDKLSWSGEYTKSDQGITTRYLSEVGIDISSTTAASYTETVNTALLMKAETTNLGLEWDAAGVKTSLEITPLHVDLEMPDPTRAWQDFTKKLTKKLTAKLIGDEEPQKVLTLKKDEAKIYLNTKAATAILVDTETWCDGIETELNSNISAMDNEVGALKQNVTVGAEVKNNINKIEAEVNELAAELVTTKQAVMANVAGFDQSKGYILRASARLSEFHA